MSIKGDGRTEVPGLYKVSEGVVINKDNEALSAYKKRRERDAAIDTMRGEISDLKSDLNEIKELLKGLVK